MRTFEDQIVKVSFNVIVSNFVMNITWETHKESKSVNEIEHKNIFY